MATTEVGATPARHSRRWYVVTAIGVALGVAFAIWWGISSTSNGISYQTIGYTHVDDRTMDVTYDVNRSPGQSVTCLVQALDARFGAVGSTQVVLPATPKGSAVDVRQTTRLRTTAPAVAGLVKVCSAG